MCQTSISNSTYSSIAYIIDGLSDTYHAKYMTGNGLLLCRTCMTLFNNKTNSFDITTIQETTDSNFFAIYFISNSVNQGQIRVHKSAYHFLRYRYYSKFPKKTQHSTENILAEHILDCLKSATYIIGCDIYEGSYSDKMPMAIML